MIDAYRLTKKNRICNNNELTLNKNIRIYANYELISTYVYYVSDIQVTVKCSATLRQFKLTIKWVLWLRLYNKHKSTISRTLKFGQRYVFFVHWIFKYVFGDC